MTTGRHQRKLSNVKLTEKYRFQYLGLWMMICFFFIALLNVAVFLLYEQMRLLAQPEGVDVELGLALDHSAAMVTILALTLAFGFSVVALAIFTAHRIGGPYIALKRTMAAIREGDLSQRLKFRDYDKLEELEAAFNEMMDSVQARAEGARLDKPLLRVAGE
jgi:methyl-accepting chemotaxis protein